MKINFKRPSDTFAAWRRIKEIRTLSSSGGVASAISEKWIENGGVVYGATFVKPFNFQHIRCLTLEDVKRLRGSKYVYSSMKGVLGLIEQDIHNGLKVLFIGIPCQVAAVSARFGNRLFTIDLICHGAPTLELFKASLPSTIPLQAIDKVEFRNNTRYQLTFYKENEIVWTRPLKKDLYMKGFFKGLFNRPSCYHCQFSRPERVGDLSLGDFLGIDKNSIDTNIEDGVSLVIVNSKNGESLLKSVSCELILVHRPIEEAIAGNAPLRDHAIWGVRNEVFKFVYPKLGFNWAAILAMPDIVIKNLLR